MKGILTPDAYVDSILSISPENLIEKGICGLILDIDNTLVPTHTGDADDKARRFINSLRECGIKTVIVSNAGKKRVERFCGPLGIDYLYKALKPMKRGYREAMSRMGLPAERIAVVGDQLFTDILGGNLLGMKTILVKPIDPAEPLFVKFKRIFEKPFLKGRQFLDRY